MSFSILGISIVIHSPNSIYYSSYYDHHNEQDENSSTKTNYGIDDRWWWIPPVDGLVFGLEGVVAECRVVLVAAWVVGSVVGDSVAVVGGSVGGKPPAKYVVYIAKNIKKKSYQLQCGSVELKKNSL